MLIHWLPFQVNLEARVGFNSSIRRGLIKEAKSVSADYLLLRASRNRSNRCENLLSLKMKFMFSSLWYNAMMTNMSCALPGLDVQALQGTVFDMFPMAAQWFYTGNVSDPNRIQIQILQSLKVDHYFNNLWDGMWIPFAECFLICLSQQRVVNQVQGGQTRTSKVTLPSPLHKTPLLQKQIAQILHRELSSLNSKQNTRAQKMTPLAMGIPRPQI